MEVTIIGGGIIGLCSALYLNKDGCEVTVIDRGNITNSCSFGNMGYISPSHFIPLASPGIISEGLKYMLSSNSPFYVKPRLNSDFLKWSWHFYKSSNASVSKKNILPLHHILQLSRNHIDDLKDLLGNTFSLEEKGCLMMCRSEKTLSHEYELADEAEKLGLKVSRLNRSQVQDLEPDVEVDVKGAVLFHDDCHFDPGQLMRNLKTHLENKGVRFQLNTTVTGIEKYNNHVTAVITDKGKFDCQNLVVAAGSWTPQISAMLGHKLLLQPGKGYSYTYPHVEKNIKYPAILVDGRCAITPWSSRLRIGGTMELSGINEIILEKRMHGIYKSAKEFYPGLQIDLPPSDKIWCGLRPVTPDGLPYIGKFDNINNTVIAAGHAMLGISQGTGTGLLVSKLIAGGKTDIEMNAFSPERF